jgi:hypothetical protein
VETLHIYVRFVCHQCNHPQTQAHYLPPEPGPSPYQPSIFAAGCSTLRPDRFTLEERGPGASELESMVSRARMDSLWKTKIPCSCRKSNSYSLVAHAVACTCTNCAIQIPVLIFIVIHYRETY